MLRENIENLFQNMSLQNLEMNKSRTISTAEQSSAVDENVINQTRMEIAVSTARSDTSANKVRACIGISLDEDTQH